MGTGYDLTDYQSADAVQDAFSALVSGGKPGYKTIIERKKDIILCPECTKTLSGEERFCPECGYKLKE